MPMLQEKCPCTRFPLTIAGYMTHMCCDTTARRAVHRGFKSNRLCRIQQNSLRHRIVDVLSGIRIVIKWVAIAVAGLIRVAREIRRARARKRVLGGCN